VDSESVILSLTQNQSDCYSLFRHSGLAPESMSSTRNPDPESVIPSLNQVQGDRPRIRVTVPRHSGLAPESLSLTQNPDPK